MTQIRPMLLGCVVLIASGLPAEAQLIQPLTCTVQATGTPAIRAEGVAELVGDTLIICNGGTAAGPNELLRPLNIRVTTDPGIDITSRLAPGGELTEALLFIDEPTPSRQNPCGNATTAPYSARPGSGDPLVAGVCAAHAGTTGSDAGVGTYDPTVAGPVVNVLGATYQTYRANAFQARRVSNNSLAWQVPFDSPGILTTRILRVTNVRVNAGQFGVLQGQQAVVRLAVTTSVASNVFPIELPLTNPVPTVAVAQPSLAFSVLDGATCLQQQSANAAFAANSASPLAAQGNRCDGRASTLRFQELFPSAFRRRSQEAADPLTTGEAAPNPSTSQDTLGFPFQTETGLYKAAPGSFWPAVLQTGQTISGPASGVPGLADSGSRLMVRFDNVPNGVAVWLGVSVPINLTQGSIVRTGTARLIQTDDTGAGPFGQLGPGAAPANLRTVISSSAIAPNYNNDGLSRVTIQGGSGVAVYEIINTDTTSIERVDIPVVYAYASSTPALGTATVTGSLGPISVISTASTSAPLPRFIDTGLNRRDLLTIANAGIPSALPPTPASGSGTAGTFTFQFDDPDGANDLSVLNVLIHSAIDGRQSCYIAYVPSGPTSGTVLLVNDAGDAGGPFPGSLSLPGAGNISNSQCQIQGAGSSASINGTRLTLTLNMAFAASYGGRKVIYQAARDAAGHNSGWVAKGVWRVPGAMPTSPRVDLVTPARDAASAVTVTSIFSDDDGFADLNILNILINNAIDGRQACYVAFVRSTGQLVLVNDAGDAGGPFAGSMTIPGSGTVSNSQCRIDASLSSASGSVSTFTLALRVTFLAPFRGDRIIYTAARDALENNSGWQAVGTVTVP